MTSDQSLKSFGARVRAEREALHISQEALADLAGVHRTYLSGIERGVRNPSLRNLVRIALALNSTVSKLTENI